MTLRKRPLIAVTEQGLLPDRRRTRLGVHQVVSSADKKAEIRRRTFEVDLLGRASEPLHKVEQRVCHPARSSIGQIVHASRLDALAADTHKRGSLNRGADLRPESITVVLSEM